MKEPGRDADVSVLAYVRNLEFAGQVGNGFLENCANGSLLVGSQVRTGVVIVAQRRGQLAKNARLYFRGQTGENRRVDHVAAAICEEPLMQVEILERTPI